MTTLIGRRGGRAPVALVLVPMIPAAAVFGALIAARPAMAIGLAAAAAVFALAFLAPATHLTLLLVATAIVPYDLQNAYGFGGGAGLIMSDVLLISAFVAAVPAVFRVPLSPRLLLAAAGIGVVLLVAVVQAARGYQAGAPASLTGYELRSLLGWATVFIVLPLIADAERRRRLFTGLVVVGILLGLWGLIQYFVNIPIIGGGSSGVRQDINFTEGARSIQGGLFGFPIAFLLGLAALSAGTVRGRLQRGALLAVVSLNGIALLLTYQRTFWLAAIIGFLFLVVRAGRGQRVKAILFLVGAAVVVLPVLAVTSPGALTAVQQRFLSLGQYSSDDSVRTRIVETRAVAAAVRDAPLGGSGLGAQVEFGWPWLQVEPRPTPYTHNGYLWLAWKLGIPAALLLVLLAVWAIAARGSPDLSPLHQRVRHGAQAGLLLSLTVSLTFPAFRAMAITTTLGILLALSFMGPLAPPSRAVSRQ
ncbi:MAG TPA: O-antigen ligase family protein [Solirubrobacteraceae bacterium]|nr:O-antigen ligase family protein [Solirubrobacteraceae bacterium]